MARNTLPITGICSFAKYPIVPPEEAEADFAVLGIPYDAGVGYLSGCRLGPRRIREVSTHYGRGSAGFYDPERDETFLEAPCRVVDCGDADIITGSIEESFEAIEKDIRTLVGRGITPVVMGGDHSISVPVARGLSDLGPLTVVQFDAHLDWTNGPGKQMYSNGCPMRRMSEMPHITGMAQIGQRGMGSSRKADFDEARRWGSRIITAREAMALGPEKVIERVPESKNYYVTIDIDSMDTRIAAGSDSPSPGGFSFIQVVDMLDALSRKGNVVCFDLVEVAPQYDPTDTSTRVAAMLMLYFMGFIDRERRRSR